MSAMNEIQYGLDYVEADELISRFLNEEAFKYVEMILIAEMIEADLFKD